MRQKFLILGPILLFPLFFVFVSISNIFDWDHFLSAAESDLRSWMIWGEAPYWSYQFCGGVTRVGDPQAFGLSPFFIFHILFGSLWGWKILVLVSSLVAFYYLERLRAEFFKETPKALSWVLILGYLFGNSYLWHMHHGHMTFVLHYWVLVLCYYYLKVIQSKFNQRDAIVTTLVAWAIFSGGFYHTAVFLGLPLAIACFLHLALGIKQRLLNLRMVLGYFGAIGGGAILAFYKWWGVLKYQLENPRVVSSIEVSSVWAIIKNVFFPTYNYHFLGAIPATGPWGIWEYSVFSWTTWIFVIGFFVSWRSLSNRLAKLDYAGKFPVILAVVSFIFYLGGDNDLYPFRALNHYLLHDSVRAIGRFGHNLVLAALLLALQLFGKTESRFLKFFSTPVGYAAAIFLIGINFFSFAPSLYYPLWPSEITSLPSDSSPEMRNVFLTRLRSDRQSFHYEPINAGRAILNCYNPIARGVYASSEMSGFVAANAGKEFPFVEFTETPTEECLRGTYYTANRIFVGSQCPKACFSLNDISPAERDKYLLDNKRKVFCTKEP